MRKFILIISAVLFTPLLVAHGQLSPLIINFDVTPKLTAATPVNLNFQLKIGLTPNAVPGCPASTDGFYWSVEERYQGSQGDYYRLVRTGFSSWPANGPAVLDFTDSVSPVGNPRYITFWASADCDNYTDGGLGQSSPVTVEVSGGQGSFSGTSGANGKGQNQALNFQIQNPVVGSPKNVLDFGILIANWIFNIAIPIVIIFIIYGGFKFVISRGNPSKVQEAKRLLWYTVIGLAIVLIGKGFIVLIQSILG